MNLFALDSRLLPLLVAAVVALPLRAGAAQKLPDLDAVLSYQSSSISRNGVTKEMRFQEKMIRRDGHLWTAPVPGKIALGYEDETPAEHAAHEHFDFESAARHLSHDAEGKLQLDYVDAARSTVVRVPPGEYEATGFTSSWASAASLIEPGSISAMQRLKRTSPVAGAIWYEQQQGRRFSRVLWSPTLQIALKIESGNVDGSAYRATTVRLLPATAAQKLPWLGLARLKQKEYDDFMD